MSEDAGSGRSLRQRTSKAQPDEPKRKRRSKCEVPEEVNLEAIYCQVNANTDFNPTPLETIYESPKGKSEGLRDCMGMVKLKRHFRFTPFYNPSKCKIKMRKNKVKKLKRINKNKSVNITLEQVEQVLKEISEDEDEENHVPYLVEEEVEKIKYENHTENQAYESDLQTFDDVESVMEVKEEMLSSYLNSESLSYEKKFEEFLKLDDDNFSPGKQNYDKTKRERRRSRRVLPLSILNSPTDCEGVNRNSELSLAADLDLKNEGFEGIKQSELSEAADLDPKYEESNKQNKLSESSKHLDPVMQVEPSSSSSIGVLCDSSKSVQNNSVRTRGRKKSNKFRRNSGINRSIYKTYDSSLDDSMLNITESISFNNDNVIKNTPSPTSLMDELRIGSPEPSHFTQHVTKKGRRKSARLSIGKAQNGFGSVWIGAESPTNDNTSQEVEKPSAMRSITNEINDCIKTEPPSNCKDTNVTEIIDSPRLELNNIESPILSGIFDCQARLSKDKSLKRKRGSHLKLNHFTFNS